MVSVCHLMYNNRFLVHYEKVVFVLVTIVPDIPRLSVTHQWSFKQLKQLVLIHLLYSDTLSHTLALKRLYNFI